MRYPVSRVFSSDHARRTSDILLRSLAICLLLGTTLQSTAQQKMSLEDCVQYAYDHSPQMTLAKLDIRDADWQIRENTAIALPQINANVNYQHFLKQPAIPSEAFGFEIEGNPKLSFALRNNLSGSVGIHQLLFDNTYLTGIKAAKEYRKYVGLKLTAVKTALRNTVVDAYLPALRLSENIDILDKNISVQEDLLHETREVQRAGFADQLDVDRLEYAVSTLRSQRDDLARQKDILVSALKFTINMPIRDEVALTDNLAILLLKYADANPTDTLDYQNKPDYVAVLKARELSEIQVDLYDKHWLPSLGAFAQYQPSYQGNDKLYWIPSAIVGLQLTIPIYDGGLDKARKERAVVTAEQVDVQKETLEQSYDLAVETARKQYANAEERVKNEEQNLELAQRIYDTAQTKFKTGLGSSLDVTQALTSLNQTQGALINARYELLQARIAIKRAFGK